MLFVYTLPCTPHDRAGVGLISEHGFAAGCAKLGAAIGVFMFPILLDDIGTTALLLIVAGGCLAGLAVTAIFRIEPRGRSLSEVSGATAAELSPHPVPP